MKKNLGTILVAMLAITSVAILGYKNTETLKFIGNNTSISRFILGYETGIRFALAYAQEVEVQELQKLEYEKESSLIPEDDEENKTIIDDDQNVEYGTIDIKNLTSIEVDTDEMLKNPYDLGVGFNMVFPQVLIIHTHGTESYTMVEGDDYEESDERRTTDEDYGVQKLAKMLCTQLMYSGINTIYASELHDYPSYEGSYDRSLDTVTYYLEKYPTIKMVIDIHRDAVLESTGVHWSAETTIDDEQVAQIMMVVGSNQSGLTHDNYMTNLNVAVNIHNQISEKYDGIMRSIYLSKSRYNQHLCVGQILVEIGASGNTQEQAEKAITIFGEGLVDYFGIFEN